LAGSTCHRLHHIMELGVSGGGASARMLSGSDETDAIYRFFPSLRSCSIPPSVIRVMDCVVNNDTVVLSRWDCVTVARAAEMLARLGFQSASDTCLAEIASRIKDLSLEEFQEVFAVEARRGS
jgi:hypothetical protein